MSEDTQSEEYLNEEIAELKAELLKYGAEIDRLQTENEELHNMVEHLLLDPRDPK